MARKVVIQADGSRETWDDQSGTYSHIDSEGVEVENRSLTSEECTTLDPVNPQIRELNEVVNQLILDMLMGGL